jgi:thiamine biosynthesis lipoprotein
MSLNRRDFLKLGLGACLLPAIGYSRAEAMVSEQMYAFGTLVDVDVLASNADAARKAIAAVSQDFIMQNREWHAWKPGALNDLNIALAAGRRHEAHPFLLPLLREVRELARSSGGLFNPAIGQLVGKWGFHDDLPPSGALPDVNELSPVLESLPSMEDVVIEGNRVSSRNAQVQIDLGGYAKGVALDRALDRLAGLGFDNAMVNLGGNLAVSGMRGDRPWNIGVRHPQGRINQGGGTLAAVEISGRCAVVTSGTYERYREQDGRRYAHIIDPRSGQPAAHVASATVIHRNAALADVAATALVVAGPMDWPETARRMGVEEVMIVDDDGRVQMTEAMARRVRFVERPLEVRTIKLL